MRLEYVCRCAVVHISSLEKHNLRERQNIFEKLIRDMFIMGLRRKQAKNGIIFSKSRGKRRHCLFSEAGPIDWSAPLKRNLSESRVTHHPTTSALYTITTFFFFIVRRFFLRYFISSFFVSCVSLKNVSVGFCFSLSPFLVFRCARVCVCLVGCKQKRRHWREIGLPFTPTHHRRLRTSSSLPILHRSAATRESLWSRDHRKSHRGDLWDKTYTCEKFFTTSCSHVTIQLPIVDQDRYGPGWSRDSRSTNRFDWSRQKGAMRTAVNESSTCNLRMLFWAQVK